MRLASLALGFALMLGPIAGASASIVSWTIVGTITLSDDSDGTVFGQGAGPNTVLGQQLSLTFFFDLARQPPDTCTAPHRSCWIPANTPSLAIGNWISSVATVFVNGVGHTLPDVIYLPDLASTVTDDVELQDGVEAPRVGQPDLLRIKDDASQLLTINGSLQSSFHANEVHVESSFANFLATSSNPGLADVLAIGPEELAQLESPADVNNLRVFRGQAESVAGWPAFHGFATATVTSVTSSTIPLPGSLALLGLGLAGIALLAKPEGRAGRMQTAHG